MMKHIKNIIVDAIKRRRQCKDIKALLMADHVTPTQIPNIYKVVFEDNFDGVGPDKYNLYDANGDKLLFSHCKHTLQHLKYGLYFVRDYDKSIGWTGGIYDIGINAFVKDFVVVKRMSLNIRRFPNKNTDTMMLQTNDEFIIFNLKTKMIERVICI